MGYQVCTGAPESLIVSYLAMEKYRVNKRGNNKFSFARIVIKTFSIMVSVISYIL